MLILTIRTDKPESELGLFNNDKQLAYKLWLAHRELAENIHEEIKQLLESQSQNMHAINGVVVYKGPGSFTGLRIGITVANALADSLAVPIVSATAEDWAVTGIAKLLNGLNEHIVAPEYGSEPNITLPKK